MENRTELQYFQHTIAVYCPIAKPLNRVSLSLLQRDVSQTTIIDAIDSVVKCCNMYLNSFTFALLLYF